MAVQATLAVLLISSTCTLAFTTHPGGINISTGFRVFRGSEQSILEGLSPRERLDVAAKYHESHIVELTSSSQAAVSQGGARISLDCLPQLSEVPGGSIQWKFIQLDEFGNPWPGKPCNILTIGKVLIVLKGVHQFND